jgi:hypothetical protein
MNIWQQKEKYKTKVVDSQTKGNRNHRSIESRRLMLAVLDWPGLMRTGMRTQWKTNTFYQATSRSALGLKVVIKKHKLSGLNLREARLFMENSGIFMAVSAGVQCRGQYQPKHGRAYYSIPTINSRRVRGR